MAAFRVQLFGDGMDCPRWVLVACLVLAARLVNMTAQGNMHGSWHRSDVTASQCVPRMSASLAVCVRAC